jgi:hypothetical protein
MLEVESMYFLHEEHVRNISNPAFSRFLKELELKAYGAKTAMVDTINEAVNEGTLSKEQLGQFIDSEIRYGHHRLLFVKDIEKNSIAYMKSLTYEEVQRLIKTKGYSLPESNFIADVHYPTGLQICELKLDEDQLTLTFARTISCNYDGVIRRETDFAFVTINFEESTFTVRIRPRGGIVDKEGSKLIKVNQNAYFYILEDVMKKIFIGLDLIKSIHFKRSMYNIGIKLTERAEKKWRKQVEAIKDDVITISKTLSSKLPDIKQEEFDLEFRLTRLLERALIQSNFEELKKKEEGKLGWVSSFVFSDNSGGKIKSSTKENGRAIELSELYYDTKDTIDKVRTFDKIWINWFGEGKRIIDTRIECTQEYYEIHFFNYILNKDELDHVLSKIRTLAQGD